MKNILGLSLVLAAGFAAVGRAPATRRAQDQQRTPVFTDTLNSTHELIGPLGKPLGEVLTITARVEEKKRKGTFEDYVTVTSVNGTPLPEPKQLPVRLWQWANIKDLKPGQQLTLRAYQDGGMIGTPQQAMTETEIVQTEGYGFMTWLVVVNEVRSATP
jgi:hypothetical protein